MTLRPYAVVIDGRLETGLEVEIDESGGVVSVSPSAGPHEDYVLSTAFVNAHSHLEYRGFEGKIRSRDYFAFIREITAMKQGQTTAAIREDCLLAATENKLTGVAYIGEHSDRPCSGQAMSTHGLEGIIFQEVITFGESASPEDKLEEVAGRLRENASRFDGEVVLNPHAPWTVDQVTLQALGEAGGKLSIHVAESIHENDYFARGTGPIADACGKVGIGHEKGERVVGYLGSLGIVRPYVQFVHACDVSDEEINRMARASVTVAHCPRSNEFLNCPRAPIREMLDAGVSVGLGLDSPATGGSIDMFAEMRSALLVSKERGAELTAEEVWRMATSMGAESLWLSGWNIEPGAHVPLLKLHVSGVESTNDLIELCSPRSVEWVTPTVRS